MKKREEKGIGKGGGGRPLRGWTNPRWVVVATTWTKVQ